MKNKKVIIIISIAIISLITIVLGFVIFFASDSDSASNNQEDSKISKIDLYENRSVEEVMNEGYVVYYSKFRYWEEEDGNYGLDGVFAKKYWELDNMSLCFGAPSETCYWVPINTGIKEQDLSKKIERAVEAVSAVRSEVIVEENEGEFIVNIDKMVSTGDMPTGEVESVTKTIELYTKNYDVYYHGEKGFDKFYDTAFPKGG